MYINDIHIGYYECFQMNLGDIACHGCDVVIPQSKSFSAYGLNWCSTTCIAPYRKEQQAQEEAANKRRDANRPKQGAFSMGGGGAC